MRRDKLATIASVVAVGALSSLVAGCSSASDSATTTLRFSTILPPDDHAVKALNAFAAQVEDESNGSLSIDVHDSGSLYDQGQAIDAVQRGDLDMTYIGPQEIQEQVPVAGLVTIPYMIDGANHLYEVMDGDVGQAIFDATVEEVGIRPLTTVYVGTRQLNLRDIGRRIIEPEDLAGVKLRVPDQDSWIYMAQALGADPVPIAFGELYLALQTGTVDAQETALPLTASSKLQEVTSQVSLTSHVVTDYWPTINEEVWQDLSDEHQDIIEGAWLSAREQAADDVLAQESELVEQFTAEGLDVYEPDVEAFRDRVQGIYLNDPEITADLPEDLLDELLASAD